ncbi:CDP-glycerol glycerophosphotransferase family protein [Amnibacterium sp.]|uniref:CDP-glycerol glycerophosphotransferase family protein n=1 Tax=Amnibacterium sp. TaxID=1872496 RepID=UPI002626E902|nr:CDP-glycerol glycerophosphotransferase family protein [Amnibacterium sp.]
MPKTASAVVYGFPASEGNAVEVVRELLAEYAGPVYWLDGEPQALGTVDPRCVPTARLSVKGLWRYLRAEIVFYTHGLYGDPAPVPGQVIVNLWHGDGVKVNGFPAPGARSIAPADYVVGSSAVLTARKAEEFGQAPSAALITGNPRTDQFWRVSAKQVRDRLPAGLREGYLVWMPTFRVARAIGGRNGWEDGTSSQDGQLNAAMRDAVPRLEAAGLPVVVRVHPLDVRRRAIPGTVLADEAFLERTNLTTSELLAGSDALITDYSSSWTDYLLLDRPIGFLMPDKQEFARRRGLFPPDVLDWLPGFDLDGHGLEDFIADVASGGSFSKHLRSAAADRLQLNPTHTAARDLLHELQARGAFPVSARVQRHGGRDRAGSAGHGDAGRRSKPRS